MSAEIGFEQYLDDRLAEFEQGDYEAFIEALLFCCGNSVPLPEWICAVVIEQANKAFDKQSTGRGRIGNWRNQLKRLQIDRTRANTIKMHLSARRRHGHGYISAMAALDGYGTPSNKHPNENAVTLEDILKAVSKQFKGTPFRGTAGEMRASYKAVFGRGRRKRR
jgi:hypothetical protein